MKNSVFIEKQSFWTWWLILVFIILWSILLKDIYQNKWVIDNSSYVGIGILFPVLLFLLVVRLNTQIDEKGISIRFLPFVRNKTWMWEEISEVYITEYSIADYGGWGYRIGKNGIAYNTKGKYGLQLLLKNNSRILIGTQKPEQIQEIIDTYNKSKS